MTDTAPKKQGNHVILDGSAPIHRQGKLTEHFGIKVFGGQLAPLAKQGTPYPNEGSYTFSTIEDGQDQITLSFYRGPGPATKNCLFLGEVRIRGFKTGPAKEPVIRLYYALHQDQIEIWAEDEKHGLEITLFVIKNREGIAVQ